MFMVAPFTGAVAAIWQGDQALAEKELPSLAELAKRNEAAMDAMLEKISQQMQLAQQIAAEKQEAELQAALAAQNGQVTSA
jgi:hypothetical protein